MKTTSTVRPLAIRILAIILAFAMSFAMLPSLAIALPDDQEGASGDAEQVVDQVDLSTASVDEDQEAEDEIGFVYIDRETCLPGEVQEIALALSDESIVLEDAVLTIGTADGSEEYPSSVIEGNAVRFSLQNLEDGSYALEEFKYMVEGDDTVYAIDLTVRELSFDVSAEAADESFEATEGEPEISVYSMDEAEELIASEDMSEAIEPVDETASAQSASSQTGSTVTAFSPDSVEAPKVIVALDPGHGGYDSGATGYGLLEKNLTLAIAKACKAELEAHGIEVFMTRSTDVYVGIPERVQLAKNAGASYFISIHINSAESSSAKGCEVWVPNSSSYNYSTHTEGTAIAKAVLSRLQALGLTVRNTNGDGGVKVRYSESGSRYSDGTLADYYGVIKRSRQAGIPGIIIEHAFISNASDATFMKSPANLTAMGKADANGIMASVGKTVVSGNGFKYQYANGNFAINSWKLIGGKWYYFGADGLNYTYAHTIGGKHYYFYSDGSMCTGWLKNSDGTWSLYASSGAMITGWHKVSGKWYYFDPADGKMLTGWQKLGNYWYYLDPENGDMLTGWHQIGGKWYCFKSSGAMASSEYVNGYWLNASGSWTYKYKASWKKNSTGWWYGDTSGWYAKNATYKIDGREYRFNSRGYWV